MSISKIVDTRKIYITTMKFIRPVMKNLPVSHCLLSNDIFKLVSYENFRDIPGIDSISDFWDNMGSFLVNFTIGFAGGRGTRILDYDSIEFDPDNMFIFYDRRPKRFQWHAITFNSDLDNHNTC